MQSSSLFRTAAAATFGLWATLFFSTFSAAAGAHDNNSAGEIRIQHPFARPTPPGATIGAAFARLENRGTQADRLIRASSPVSARMEIHSGGIGADGVMRMREVDGLPIAPKATLRLRPGQGHHLMLIDLKKPLIEGQTFAMTLEFERAGKVEVKVVVQVPKPADRDTDEHKH